MKAKLTFLGTGTSQGVPIIGCGCEVCRSKDPRDKRFRSSALVEYGGLKILIDAGPDFRSQMLRAGVNHLDAILLTHDHRDHTGGLDDVRSLNYIDQRAAEIYCEERVLASLKESYSYAFAEEKYPGAPEWNIHLIDSDPFFVEPSDAGRKLVWVRDQGYCYVNADGTCSPTGGNRIVNAERVPGHPACLADNAGGNASEDGRVAVVPIRGMHDQMPVLGFRFGGIAYLTDMSSIPESEFAKLRGLEHVTLNTVSYRHHHSHFSLEEAVEIAERINARHTWLTHLSHTFPTYAAFDAELRRFTDKIEIHPAFDGLKIEG
ncbi:MAG: MBL fold metallo-hydrolase [Candidatus Cryptobacteroides sp.]